MINITLVYVGKTGKLFLQELSVPTQCTIIQAIELSSIFEKLGNELNEFRQWLTTTAIDTPPNHKHWLVGIFSVKKPLNYVLEPFDRIEIYRPLGLDPMKTRAAKVNYAKKQAARLRSNPNFYGINQNQKID